MKSNEQILQEANELNRQSQPEPDTFDTKQQLPIDDVIKVINNSNCSTIDKINILNALSEYLKVSNQWS